MNKYKFGWTLSIVFAIFSAFLANWLHSRNNNEVEFYKFSEIYQNSNVKLKTIERGGLPFKFLFADAVKSPFSFEMNLKGIVNKEERSVWIYSGQAHDHGVISVDYDGMNVGIVNNKLSEKTSEPLLNMSHVGNLKIKEKNIILKITGTNENLDRHYSELGLLILAPPQISKDVLLSLLNGKEDRRVADMGRLTLVLLFAYCLLVWLSRNFSTNNIKNNSLIIFILITVALFSYFSFGNSMSPPLGKGAAIERTGIEKLIEEKTNKLFKKISIFQGRFLRSNEVKDAVPDNLIISKGVFETKVYSANAPMSPKSVYEEIFNGTMAEIQRMSAVEINCVGVFLLIVIAVFIFLSSFLKFQFLPAIALGFISSASVFFSIRLSSGWDEFFINLRHAYMLKNFGVYSINSQKMLEASVDFFPLLLTTALAKMGIALVDAFITTSLIGVVGIIVVSYMLIEKLTKNKTWSLIGALLVSLYPNVIYVGATGFSAVLFTAWMFMASYFLIFSSRRSLGLILLSTLTIVRTDGILFSLLLISYMSLSSFLLEFSSTKNYKSWVKNVLNDLYIIFLPFVASLCLRFVFFNHAIPNPVSFKNTNFDATYIAAGLDRFLQIISIHDLHIILLVTVILLIVNLWPTGLVKSTENIEWRSNVKKLAFLNIVTFIFILPYYIGGGDWFPAIWNRYSMSLNIIVSLTFFVLLYGIFFHKLQGWTRWCGLVVFSIAIAAGYLQSIQTRDSNYIRAAFSEIMNPNDVKWQRVDNLASLGQFFKKVLPLDAVVASPEEATIMYFSEREMLGLLGVSNPDITKMPLQPMNPGDILHRKRAYASIFKDRPDIIALYEPVAVNNFESVKNIDDVEKITQSAFFNEAMVNIDYYRVGSFKALEEMGYVHFSIVYTDRIFSFFVNKKINEEFQNNLLKHSLKYEGTGIIPYSVNPELSRKYLPAVKELINKL